MKASTPKENPGLTQLYIDVEKIQYLAWAISGILAQPSAISTNFKTVMNNSAVLVALIEDKAKALLDDIKKLEDLKERGNE